MTLVLRYTSRDPQQIAEELTDIQQAAAAAAKAFAGGRLEVRDVGWAALLCGSDDQKTYVTAALAEHGEMKKLPTERPSDL